MIFLLDNSLKLILSKKIIATKPTQDLKMQIPHCFWIIL